jgi:hypothetical protein
MASAIRTSRGFGKWLPSTSVWGASGASGITGSIMIAAGKSKVVTQRRRAAPKPDRNEGGESPAGSLKYKFAYDFFEHNIPLYEKYLGKLKDKPCRLLEIGSLEGGSTTWLLDHIATHDASRVDTIDVYENPNLMPNLIASGHRTKVQFHHGRSIDILRTLPVDAYDLAIIDGSHWTMNVLEDMVHSFRLLKVGGLMETDDYLWDDPDWNQEGTPKAAVDAFLSIYSGKIEVIHKDWRVWLQKIADPLFGL